MTILLATLAGLVFWLVAWALGVKGFDALMVTILIVLGACAWHIFSPYLPGNREDPDDPRSGGSWLSR